METLKVSAKSNPKSVAGAIVGATQTKKKVEIQCIGAGAVNQSVKAVSIARNYVKGEGAEFSCTPNLIDVEIENEKITGVQLIIERH